MQDSADTVTKDLLQAPVKRGRKPLAAAVAVDSGVPAQAVTEVVAAADAQAETHSAMDEVLAAGVDLGRLEALTFIQTVSETAALAIYEKVKKSKAWRLLRNPESSNGLNFSSLDEFCQIKLGRGYARMQMIAGNQRAIGEEAFEQAERLGLHQRDYNAIKALPAPDQELVRRAVEEAQSRDEVLDLLQELAARHAKEKEVLTSKAEKAEAAAAAKDRVLADNAAKINEQAQALELARSEKFTPAPGSVARTKAEAVLLKEVFTQSLRVNGRMRALFAAVNGALSDSGGNAPEAIQQAARAAVQYLAQQFADIAREFDIAIDLDERIEPPWTADDEAALVALAAKNAAEDEAAHRPTH